MKFSNFGNSVEILFALINGDSIWMVFRAFDSHDIAVYVYSRFFVYVFIFLFIYAVLNLFTSLVKTSYDESTVGYISICVCMFIKFVMLFLEYRQSYDKRSS